MKPFKLFLILFLLFIFQGTLFTVFSPQWFGVKLAIVPHFVMVAVLFVGLFVNRGMALRYGLILGFLIDIVYTNVLGVYAFCMGVTVYLLSFLPKLFHLNVFVVFIISLLGVSLLEIEVYFIYSLIGLAQEPFLSFLSNRLWQTALLNGVFALIIFVPYRRFLLTLEMGYSEES